MIPHLRAARHPSRAAVLRASASYDKVVPPRRLPVAMSNGLAGGSLSIATARVCEEYDTVRVQQAARRAGASFTRQRSSRSTALHGHS
jgi:hypothetical protein